MALSKSADEDMMSYPIKLYSCSFVTPPERDDHYSLMEVGTITTNLSGLRNTDVESRYNPILGKTVYQYRLEIQIGFRSQEGNLAFRARAHGKESGVTTIKYRE